MPIQQTEKEVVYKKIHDEIPMNATYKTRVIFTGNSPVLVLICTIDHDIYCMHGRPPHTSSNIHDGEIIFDIHNLSQKMP